MTLFPTFRKTVVLLMFRVKQAFETSVASPPKTQRHVFSNTAVIISDLPEKSLNPLQGVRCGLGSIVCLSSADILNLQAAIR